MQPSFAVELPLSADDAIGRIRQAIAQPEMRDHAISAGTCAEFFVDEDQRRFWSPHLLIVSGLILGASQWMVRETPWGFWCVPLGIIAIVLLHAASLTGQRLSRDQMGTLHERLNWVLRNATEDDGDVA